VERMASEPKAPDFAQLSVAERLDLMDRIWESLASMADSLPLPEWHLAEIERRLATFAEDGNRGRPVDEVFAELKRRL